MLAAAIAVSATLFAVRVRFLAGLLRAAPAVDRSDDVGRRVENEATIVLGQRKLLQRFGPGLIHAFIFWGFLVLLPTILIALIGVVDKNSTLPWLGHQGWFALLVDIFAVLVLVGVVSALWIRKVQRPKRFEGSHLGEADLILAMIATIATTLLLWHATRIALGLNEWPASWSPVSNALSHLFSDDQATKVLERVFVWLHVLTILTFLAYLPRSKHLHIATAALNVWFGRTGPGGRLEPLRFDDPDVPEDEIRFGAGTAADLTCKQVLDAFSCTECGRCQDVCPAFGTGKTLSPKLVIMGLRDQLLAGPSAGRGAAAGAERGPRGVGLGLRHLRRVRPGVPGVDRARRPHRRPAPAPGDGRVEFPGRGRADAARRRARVEPVGESAVRARRLGGGSGVRVLEPGDPPPEYLYWVGCAASFDERARDSAESTAKLLQAAGVDFAILGPRETLHRRPGAPDRQRVRVPGVRRAERLDAERRRREEDRRQLPALLQHARQRVPGLRRQLRGDPPLGAARVAGAGRPDLRRRATPSCRSPTTTPATWPATTTCSRGRASSLPPSASPSRWPARASRRSAAAPAAPTCGWRSAAKPINEERVREAAATGAGTLAVACPFCTVMLDDGVQSAGQDLRVVDVATLLAEGFEDGPGAGDGASPD